MIISHFLVPRVLFEHSDVLSLSATVVYLRLWALVDPGETRITLSTAHLAAHCGLTQRTIFAAVAQLEQVGLVERKKSGPTCVNEYCLVVPPHPGEEGVLAPIDDCSPTSQACGGAVTGIVTAPAKLVRHEPGIEDDEPAYVSESGLKPLDDLIGAAFSDKYCLADVQACVDMKDSELRACLERLSAEGGVSSNMSLGFFVAVIRKVRHEIYGGEMA